MSTASICILVAMIVYLIGMLVIGFVYSGKSESSSDFYLGGRRLGPFVTAMSAEASDMSSYLLMGLPGLAYFSGLADVGWTVIGLALGTYFNWLFTAKRLRRYTQVTNSFTLPQFFSNRFHDKHSILNAISAIVIIIFFVPYTASGFAACGKLFRSLFGMDYMVAVIGAAIVIISYTVAGGFLAASMTDFIQSIVMTIAIMSVLVFATISAGGVDAVVSNAEGLPGYLSMTETYVAETGTSEPYGILTIIATMSWGLGYFGMPHILLRFMATKDEKKLKLSRRVASVWVVIAMSIAVLIGIVGKQLTANGSIGNLATSGESETIIVKISDFLSQYGVFAALLAGLILSGILASTMSTADSQLLAAASSVSQNILQDTFKIKIPKKMELLIARGTVVIIAIIGVLIASDPDSSVFGIVSFAWAGFGASFGPVMILSLFWKRATLPGAIAGMCSGGVMVFVWKYAIKPMGGIFNLYELGPAFIIAIVVMVIVSLLTKKPSQEIIDEFELAKSNKELN